MGIFDLRVPFRWVQGQDLSSQHQWTEGTGTSGLQKGCWYSRGWTCRSCGLCHPCRQNPPSDGRLREERFSCRSHHFCRIRRDRRGRKKATRWGPEDCQKRTPALHWTQLHGFLECLFSSQGIHVSPSCKGRPLCPGLTGRKRRSDRGSDRLHQRDGLSPIYQLRVHCRYPDRRLYRTFRSWSKGKGDPRLHRGTKRRNALHWKGGACYGKKAGDCPQARKNWSCHPGYFLPLRGLIRFERALRQRF